MSNLHGFVQQDNVARAADGTSVGLRATRDGSLLTVPWIQALCLEGRVFGAFTGAADLDATGGGTLSTGVINNTEFDYHQVVPSTVAVLPIYLKFALVATGTIAELTVAGAWGTGSVVGGNSVALTEFNYRPGSSNTSACTVVALADTGGTALAEEGFFYVESSTAITGVAGTAQAYIPAYSVVTAGFVPIVEGARQVVGWVGSQAGSGYIQSAWVELPISAIN